jgi:hypothetical protein
MPIEERRRLGNPQRRPIPGGGNLAAVPAIEARSWDLAPDAALQRVLGAGVGWLAESDAVQVALLREALRVAADADRVGSLRERLEAIKVASSLLSELGFTPSARARLGLAEVKAMSRLEAMQAARRPRS